VANANLDLHNPPLEADNLGIDIIENENNAGWDEWPQVIVTP
jgi:hypothetical protein